MSLDEKKMLLTVGAADVTLIDPLTVKTANGLLSPSPLNPNCVYIQFYKDFNSVAVCLEHIPEIHRAWNTGRMLVSYRTHRHTQFRLMHQPCQDKGGSLSKL